MICILADDDSSDSVENAANLQQRFEAMRARRTAAAARVRAAELAQVNKRTTEDKKVLRKKFLEQVQSYVGTPYSAARCGEDAALYLDCCGLVRRALLDLKEDFGFEVGQWNQSYLFDTLPTAVAEEELQPGDLIFWTGQYDDPQKKPQKHDLVHVEVYLGGGERTIGSRYEGAETVGVGAHETYRSFSGHAAHDHKLFFRSIDAWLEGVCVSHCKTCTWGEPRKNGKSKLFGDAATANAPATTETRTAAPKEPRPVELSPSTRACAARYGAGFAPAMVV